MIKTNEPKINIYSPREINVSKRMRRTSFQARLGRRLDNISRKITDNAIRLSSHPTDMLRIKVNRNDSGDLISRTIQSVEILPIILPVMKDIPMRRLEREKEDGVLIPSLYPIQDQEYFTIYSPVEVQLDEDDLLIRLIYIEGTDEPYCLVLQVKEILSTIGYNSLIWNKINVTIYDEPLPPQVLQIIKDTHIKRDELGW